MNLTHLGEFGMIGALSSGLQTRAGTVLGIGDDCAVLETLQTPIVTLDALVEGVHFRRDWTSPRALGRKAMAVSVSDLASCGARPVAAFVSLCLGARDDLGWVQELYRGFEDAAQQFDFTLAGGDTTRSKGDLVLSVTLIGEILNPDRGPILRSGAQAGDWLLVTGTLGDAAAGLAILQGETAGEARAPTLSPTARAALLHRHHEPTPRLGWMKQLLGFDAGAIHAALDLSDGLSGDASHLAKCSGVRLEIKAEKLPISTFCHEAARVYGLNALDWALSGGEDYELLLAMAPDKAESLLEWARGAGIELSEIGRCTAPASGEAADVEVRQNGEVWAAGRAWTHF